ncbi:hypothetical protein [Kushneria sp. AK178]
MAPANRGEGLHKAVVGIAEGAEAVMIMPGLPCPDVLYRVRRMLRVPTFVYRLGSAYTLHRTTPDNGGLSAAGRDAHDGIAALLQASRCRWHPDSVRRMHCAGAKAASRLLS